MQFVRKNRILVAIAGSLLFIGILVYAVLSWHNGISNTGREKQRDLITLENNIEIALSNCLDTGDTAAKVVMQQHKTLKDELVSIAEARYTDNSRANAAIGGGTFISALQEAYPLIDQTTWNNLMNLVVSCRQQVAAEQTRLQYYAGEFDKWRQTGGVIERTVRNNFPNDQLHTEGPDGKEIYGLGALEHLMTPISIEDVKEAMKTRKMPSQELFPTEPAAPAPSATPTR